MSKTKQISVWFKNLTKKQKAILCAGSVLAVTAIIGGSVVAYNHYNEVPVAKEIAVKEKEVIKEDEVVTAKITEVVKGIKDWTVVQDAKDVDFMDGVTFNKEFIKAITFNSSKVDFSKVGKYDLVYTIEMVVNQKDNIEFTKDFKVDSTKATVTKNVVVEIVTKEEAKKEADKGNVVTATNNEIVEDSKGNTPEPKKEAPIVSSSNSSTSTNSNSTTTKPAKTSKPSQPTTNNNSNTGSSNNSGSTMPSKPAHTHNYSTPITQTKTRTVTKYKTEQQDQGSYQQVQTGTTPETKQWVCGCGQGFNSGNFDHPSNNTVKYIPGQPIYENKWVSKIVNVQVPYQVQEQYTETVGYKCSCGATK